MYCLCGGRCAGRPAVITMMVTVMINDSDLIKLPPMCHAYHYMYTQNSAKY